MKYMKLKKVLLAVLIIAILALIVLIFIPTRGINISMITKTHKKRSLVSDILINNNSAIYDKKKKVFYFSNYSILKDFEIGVKSKYKVKYSVISNKNRYYLFVYSDKYYEKIPITITNTPLINIIYPDNPDIDYFNKDDIIETTELYKVKSVRYNVIVQMLANDNKKSHVFKEKKAVLNIRGTASALFHPKKSYRLKFSEKVNVLNIVDDDAVALDALSTDISKIRNLLSSNMWNLINNDQNIDNDLYGDFVEVFINGQYTGLYVLKDKVNKGTLSVDDNGLVVKDIAKNNQEFIDALLDDRYLYNYSYNVQKSGYFLNYQIKQYNDDSFISFVYKLRDYYQNGPNYDAINSGFYMKNYVDYFLFVALISGKDNVIYNKYYSLKNPDSKILLTPWDMDLTWGLDWSYELKLHSISSLSTSWDKDWMDEYIKGCTDQKVFDLMKERYIKLRKNVITYEVINNYISNYEKKIIDTDAYKRDINKWGNYDIKKELKLVRSWAKKRIKFLDEYFGR